MPLFLCVAVLVMAGARSSAQSADQPNVLFIAVDDLNDWVGFLDGHPDVQTPYLDRLAARGTVFTNAHCNSPVCVSSRASFMSGLYPQALAATGIKNFNKDDNSKAAAEAYGAPLIHESFARHGYETLAVGKILHRHVPEGTVAHSGGRGSWNKHPDGKLKGHEVGGLSDWGVYPEDAEPMADALAAEWAEARLAETRETPFLLMVGMLRPHAPWLVPQAWHDRYPGEVAEPPLIESDMDDVSPYVIDKLAKLERSITKPILRLERARETGEYHNLLKGYLASITFVDAQIGRVLDALDASPYADNTIVVLFSDHGIHMGEKTIFKKGMPWEESTKVPLIIAGPGVPAGQRVDAAVSLIDLYPTLLDLASLSAEPTNQGNSLVPLIETPTTSWDHVALTRAGIDYTIRTDRYRYIRYDDGSEELYDHTSDPNEWHNLIGEPAYADTHAALSDRLTQALADSLAIEEQ